MRLTGFIISNVPLYSRCACQVFGFFFSIESTNLIIEYTFIGYCGIEAYSLAFFVCESFDFMYFDWWLCFGCFYVDRNKLHVHVLGVLRGSRVHRTTTAHKILANWIAPKSYCIENAKNQTWKLGRCQWNAQIKRLKITMNHAECHWMFAWKITSKYHHWHTGTNQRTNERICWIGINI